MSEAGFPIAKWVLFLKIFIQNKMRHREQQQQQKTTNWEFPMHMWKYQPSPATNL